MDNLGNGHIHDRIQAENAPFLRNQEKKKTQIAQHNYNAAPYNSVRKFTKKSDMPEKSQIKFMKSLLGKVKILLHKESDHAGEERLEGSKITAYKIPEKISAVASDKNKVYGVLGKSTGNDGEKSVNIISIPLNALKNFASLENDMPQEKLPGDMSRFHKGTQMLLKPMSVGLASSPEENKEITSFVPIVLPNQPPQVERLKSYSVYPDGPNNEPSDTPRLPFIIERHGDILKHNKNEEGLFKDNKGDKVLYRDVGHIPGEVRYHHYPLVDPDIERRPSLRHQSPVRHRPRYNDDDEDSDEDDDQDDDTDDDEYDEDDTEDDDEEENPYDYRNSPQMRAEAKRIASTRKQLYDMLPGNDPTYTSENRGLGIPMRPGGIMQAPEAFLGNPMIQPGVGVNQRALSPFLGEALAGEHADNSNNRNVFIFGGQRPRQVYGDSESDSQDVAMHPETMKVNSGGFSLGGAHGQAMSPNEVSYMLQKPGARDQLSQKDKITHPSHRTHSILLKVNGHAVGDSSKLRDHTENGRVFKGKEKLFESKGPMDVKVSKANDGVHSKIVDITSTAKVNVLEAKSKIARSH